MSKKNMSKIEMLKKSAKVKMNQLIKVAMKIVCLFCMIFILSVHTARCSEDVVKVGFTLLSTLDDS